MSCFPGQSSYCINVIRSNSSAKFAPEQLRWPEPIYMRVGYVFDFHDFCILNKEWSNFKRMLFIFYRYKNVRDIGICLKPHFYKKCQ